LATLTRFVGLPGFLGVDVFFVLSGFILSYNYAALFDRGCTLALWRQFLSTRLARIYPVHFVLLVALAVAVLGFGLDGGGQIDDRRWSIAGLIQSLLLVQAWFGNWDVWNSVSWSISCEWLAYLSFPVFSAAALMCVRGRLSAPAILLVILALPALRDTVDRHVVPLPVLFQLPLICEFAAGCIAYRLFVQRSRDWAFGRHPAAMLVLLVAGAAICEAVGIPSRWTVLVVPSMLLGLAHGHGRVTRFFAHPWMVYWGKVSFALYMTHYLWLWVMHTIVPLETVAAYDAPLRVVIGLVHVLPPFAIAAAMYHVVEEPSRRWLTHRVAAQRPPAAVTALSGALQ
jgi:peptidoglycan/LPS O-acetylase OafA/YrhL